MNLHALPAQTQKAVAVALAAAVLILVLLAVLLPLANAIVEKRGQLSQLALEQQKWEAVLDQQAETVTRIDRILADPRLNSRMLSTSSGSENSAAIQSAVRDVLRSANVTVRSLLALEPQADGLLEQVGVSISTNLSSSQLNEILNGFLSSNPELFVRSINIRSTPAGRSMPGPNQAPELAVQMEVFAFSRSAGTVQ